MKPQIAWETIQFHGFGEDDLAALNRRWNSLQISCQQPELVEVPCGIIESRKRSSTRGDKHVVGVYTREGEPVASSARIRDLKVAPAPSRSFAADLPKDPRCAYYLGVDAAHFGHFILETLCRAWAWPDCAQEPVAVIQAPPLKGFARSFLRLVPGLAQRTEIVASTTQFATVLVPSPTFVIGNRAHQAFKNLCCRIAEQAGAANLAMTEQPVYISRAGWATDNRAIIGEVKLEEFLAGQGFRIVRPETLPVTEQIAVMNQHKWIVASMGSACHTRLFALRPTNLLMFVSRLLPNYILCDLLNEGETHYAKLLTASDFLPQRSQSRKQRLPKRTRQPPAVLEANSLIALLKEFGLLRAKSPAYWSLHE